MVVMVEETEAARTALRWAVGNFIRCEDSITLLHVYPKTRSIKRRQSMRLEGFQLALSFKDMCNGIAEAKVEILVIEGETATSVVSIVNKIRATTLVVGIHDKSFLYKRSCSSLNVYSLNCRILAVKQRSTTREWFINAELSEVQMTTLRTLEGKAPYPIFPCPMWKRSRRRRLTPQV